MAVLTCNKITATLSASRAAANTTVHCTQCGQRLIRKLTVSESRERLVCSSCGHIDYENPKILVACLVTFGDRVLLCRRALAPAYGLWAPPGGFLESGETPHQAAAREVWEETGVRIACDDLVLRGLTCLTELNQVYANFSGSASCGDCQPGIESLDAAFFSPQKLPWDELAYPAIAEDLRQFLHERRIGRHRVRANAGDGDEA